MVASSCGEEAEKVKKLISPVSRQLFHVVQLLCCAASMFCSIT